MKIWKCPYDHGWISEPKERNGKMYCPFFSYAGGTLHGEVCMGEMTECQEVAPAEDYERIKAENATLGEANKWLTYGIGSWCHKADMEIRKLKRLRKLLEGTAETMPINTQEGHSLANFCKTIIGWIDGDEL